MTKKKRRAPKRAIVWLAPHEVFKRISDTAVQSIDIVFFENLRGGLIQSEAENTATLHLDGSTSKTGRFKIPQEYWEALSSPSDQLWNAGIARFDTSRGYELGTYDRTTRCFGIRFEQSGVERLVESLAKKMPQASTITSAFPVAASQSGEVSRHPGGAPKKDFWDELWAAICAQIYLGSLKPEKQADVEKAMLDWAAIRGRELSLQSARSRARKLMAALKSEDKK